MWLFYDYSTKEINILPSENLNKAIELTKSVFYAYTTENDFVEITNSIELNKFYKKVQSYNETEQTYQFKDMFKNKYKVIRKSYMNENNEMIYSLYQFMGV
jgi:hypothetical protein